MTGRGQPVLLCTNDDGVQAGGLSLLARVAEAFGDVWTVAPDREQSATSHALSLHRPIRLTQLSERRYMVDGTPTDCVLLAVKEILETPPGFVLSGVNHGPNMGEDVLYSGTVAGAMEATILGVPAIAFSFTGDDETVLDTYANLLGDLIGSCLRRTGFPDETFLNVNLPNRPASEVEGVVVTALGRRVYHDSLRRSRDPQGYDSFRIGGGHSAWRGREDSDFRAVRAGYVSVTPLHLDLTNFELLNEVRSWGLGS
ncbi:5'/3'-nucleotidase SurE [Candidatus Palauibacter sp.]|uniref:5'/3'-nucleotidase SurE n=1 Tax=Candidatus Palauibacter sp. TaxID=3101350 RepID=UPI003AF318B9